jgi:6-phosphogluconate dehydrogenase
MSVAELTSLYDEWNRGNLSSYLIEITADILARVDEQTGKPLLDLILDEAQQKGTGAWTVHAALDLGAPIPGITAAVEARVLSSFKSQRVAAARVLAGPTRESARVLAGDVHDALYCSFSSTYAQGFSLLAAASKELEYALNLAELARIWRGGCIIRSAMLARVQQQFHDHPELANLLTSQYFAQQTSAGQAGWRRTVGEGVRIGMPLPAMGAALAYHDAYRAARLPANLIQAQRDYFGAHGYRRTDREGDFHSDWRRHL